MKVINLETCDRTKLDALGIRYEDVEVRRMSASNLRDNWTEHHAHVDEDTLPKGSLLLKCGAFWGSGAVAIKNGKVVADRFKGACPWWDDSVATLLALPEDGETLHYYTMGMNSSSFEYGEDPTKSSTWLIEHGAYIDGAERAKEEEAERRAIAKKRYEAAKERCELLYPYVAPRIFRAHIRWALEDGVAEAAKVLSTLNFNIPSINRGWCHFKDSLTRKWFRKNGFGTKSEEILTSIIDCCRKITCPRLDSAIEIAKIMQQQ